MNTLFEKAALIKLLVLDVDGVMTNGKLYVNDLGAEFKAFDVKDGLGIKALTNAGIEVAIISARDSKAVEYRAENLGLKKVYLGKEDKKEILLKLIKDMGLGRGQVCCMGDDLPDIPMFKHAGLSITVADACIEIRQLADLITHNPGGQGAVREAAELILKAQGKWKGIISGYTGSGN